MHPKTQISLLIANGMTQENIAKTAKVSQSTISRILNGEIENPNWVVASRIGELYHCTIHQTESA